MALSIVEEDEIINKAMKIILKRHKNDISTNTLLNYIKKNINYSYKEIEQITEEGSNSYTEKLHLDEEMFEEVEDEKALDDDIIEYLFNDILDETSSMDKIFIISNKDYIYFEMYSDFRNRRKNITYFIPYKYILLLNKYIEENKNEVRYEDFTIRN
jgi:hypothetical protein